MGRKFYLIIQQILKEMVRHFMKQIISYFKIKVNVFGSKDMGSINNYFSNS